MTKDNFKFQFQNEKNEAIDCELILSFYIKKLDKNFFIFTDYTKDSEDYLNVYPYYQEKDTLSLIPVSDKKELKIVNTVYETVKSEVRGN